MPNIKDDLLFNPSDFKTMIIKINLTNVTTQAEIRDGKRCYGKGISKQSDNVENDLEISISEFLENGLILDIPSKTCADNHTIMIEVRSENTEPLVNFKATLKVNSIEKISKESDMAEATFIQKDEKEWAVFQSILSRKQEDIRNLFNSIKGYEST
jgi:hypothetical protein